MRENSGIQLQQDDSFSSLIVKNWNVPRMNKDKKQPNVEIRRRALWPVISTTKDATAAAIREMTPIIIASIFGSIAELDSLKMVCALLMTAMIPPNCCIITSPNMMMRAFLVPRVLTKSRGPPLFLISSSTSSSRLSNSSCKLKFIQEITLFNWRRYNKTTTLFFLEYLDDLYILRNLLI